MKRIMGIFVFTSLLIAAQSLAIAQAKPGAKPTAACSVEPCDPEACDPGSCTPCSMPCPDPCSSGSASGAEMQGTEAQPS